MNLTTLSQEQERLATKLIIPPDGTGYQPQADDLIFTLDVQYLVNKAHIVLDVQRWSGEQVAIYVASSKVTIPYVPQFFCFREGPPLLALIQKVQRQFNRRPDLILVDGHGLAHPRRFGVACWVGLKTNIPTIGCAKRSLLAYTKVKRAISQRGDTVPIHDQADLVGTALTTQSKVKPVFVSPGHLVSHKTATQMVLGLASRYRLPEPIRRADQHARNYAKGQLLPNATDLGQLIGHG
ncbi:endonuclease V [Anaerolineales bacterium HSG25]|nr:endonuclease V [Anaerolineales bacterium HSG25]